MNTWTMIQTTLADWEVVWIPFAVVIITQFLKVLMESRHGGFQWKHLNSYGGMPSSHTALCVSLMIIVGLTAGWNTPVFSVAAVTAIVFIRDAVGIRWSLGFHGKVLNQLIHLVPADKRDGLPQALEERLGHRPIEALAGGVFGACVTLLLHWFVQ